MRAFGSSAAIAPSIVLVAGRLFYSEVVFGTKDQSSIVSCDAAACPAGKTTVLAPPFASSVVLLAGDAQSLFYFVGDAHATSGPISRCELSGCASGADLGIYGAFGTDLIDGDLFVVSGNARNGIVARCPRSGCQGSTAPPLPDVALAGSNRGSDTLGPHPFAVDARATYWATSTILGRPGNLVVATPR
jgi:hypothetical protein